MAERRISISAIESPEYRALEISYPMLVGGISRSPGEIVDQLISLRALSDEEIVVLRSSLLNDKEKARKIIDVVKIRIKLKPAFFDKFIKILEKNVWMKDRVDMLKANFETEKQNDVEITDQLTKETSSSRQNPVKTNEPDSQVEGLYSHVSAKQYPPVTSEIEFDESDLENRTCKIQYKFSSLVTKVGVLLKRNQITTEDLSLHLSRLTAFVTSDHIKGTSYFTPEFIEQIKQKCKSNVSKVFNEIQKFYSWFNFDLIGSVIDAYLWDNDYIQTQWEEYQTYFKDYCKKRMCPIPKILSEKKQTLSTSCQESIETIFKIDHQWNKIRFDRLVNIQASITSLFNLKPYVLQLRTVRQGCVELVFEVPQHVADVIFPPTEEQLQALQEHNIKFCGILTATATINDDSTSNTEPGFAERYTDLAKSFERVTLQGGLSLTKSSLEKPEDEYNFPLDDTLHEIFSSDGTQENNYNLSLDNREHQIIPFDETPEISMLGENISLNDIQSSEKVMTWTIAAIGERNAEKYEIINGLLGQELIDCPISIEDVTLRVKINNVHVEVFDLNKFYDIRPSSAEKINKMDTIFYFLPENDYHDTLKMMVSLYDPNIWKKCVIIVDCTRKCSTKNKLPEDKIFEARQVFEEVLLGIQVSRDIVEQIQIVPRGEAVSRNLRGYEYWFSVLCWTVLGVSSTSSQEIIVRIFEKRINPKYNVQSGKLYLQPIPPPTNKLSTKDKILLAAAGGGAAAAAGGTGATIGALIGALAIGIPSFGVAAGVGLVIGGLIGGGVGVGVGGAVAGGAAAYKKRQGENDIKSNIIKIAKKIADRECNESATLEEIETYTGDSKL